MTRAPQPCQEIPVEQVSGGVLARMRPELSVGAALPPAGRQPWGGGSPGAWHAGVAWATMPGWLVMTAGPRCCGRPCPFWTRPGPRGCSGGCLVSPRLLPRLWSGAGTGPPGAGVGPWPRGRALPATGWWRGAWAPKRRPRPRRDRTCNRTCNRTSSGCKGRAGCASLAPGPGCRRDADTRGPPPIAGRPLVQGRGHPPVQACFHCRGDGHRRVVGPALAAAADGARDRRRSPEGRDRCPLGGPGRAAAQAEDRRRVGLVAAGSVARLRAAAAEPLR